MIGRQHISHPTFFFPSSLSLSLSPGSWGSFFCKSFFSYLIGICSSYCHLDGWVPYNIRAFVWSLVFVSQYQRLRPYHLTDVSVMLLLVFSFHCHAFGGGEDGKII